MTLDQLRIFVEVAALEHITRAAERLNMTQSAVSAAISALETRHDIRLFDRVGRMIVLNQAGRSFLAEAQAVLNQARVAEAALNDLSGLMRGRLSVMASQTVGSYWLPERLALYRRRYPGIEIAVRIGNSVETSHAVTAGEVEIGVIEWMSDAKELTKSVADIDEMIVVVAPDHPWADGRPRRVENFPEIDWVLREEGSGTRYAFERIITDGGVALESLKVPLIMPENEAVLGAVIAGMGATLLSRSVVKAVLQSGQVRQLNMPAFPRPYYFLRHSQRYRSRAGEAFEALCREQTPAA
ncbi:MULTISPECIES: LysR family transcriptional regulator [unclassified Rhizobium]|uniref:LysR family transcriptional regulator n=1 Tax=unclassified Rhizobium TaxID=2613769 RepID=UPI000701F490|nr:MULTISPECIES: LysR family transcriptional regulator [unclassified Rhizobium]KQV38352.1 LysR family transcriptional regulator [Rhizobium sp. Root1212]KRD31007.1 LysR family transcriptional regulator [Rhizobium sp. Root268]